MVHLCHSGIRERNHILPRKTLFGPGRSDTHAQKPRKDRVMGVFATGAANRALIGLASCLVLVSCAGDPELQRSAASRSDDDRIDSGERTRIQDLFLNNDDPNTTLEVNKYIWNAALDVLNFLPLQSADPFSGVIVTGYGTPPGGRTAYRATIYVRDPALEARSLNVALATRSGPAPTETVRAVEDAILTRARQLRIRELGL